MRKFVCFIFFILFISNITLAYENITTLLKQSISDSTMPSDEQIMNTLNNFGLTQEEASQVFVEAKKQLEQIYNSKDASSFLQQNLSTQEAMQNVLPEVEETMQNIDDIMPMKDKRIKKYTNHPPLTR